MKSSIVKSPLKEKAIDTNKVIAVKASKISFWQVIICIFNLAILLGVSLLIYIAFTNYYYKNLDNNSFQITSSLNEINLELQQLKSYNNELQKAIIADEKVIKNSRDYNINLMVKAIKDKIIVSGDFQNELNELEKLINNSDDPNIIFLKKYIQNNTLKVKDIIIELYDHNSNNGQTIITTNYFWDSIKSFFSTLFQIKKVEDNKIHLNTNQLNSIVLQLLIDGHVEAAYSIANKFSNSSEIIARVTKDLESICEALKILNRMQKMVIYND